MKNFVGYIANKIVQSIPKSEKVSPTIKSVYDMTKGTNVSNQKKSEIKKSFSGKVSNIINPEKKAKGGRVGLKKGSFPDFSGDGKTTMKDILMARGVIPKPKNKKKMMTKKSKSPMDKTVRKS